MKIIVTILLFICFGSAKSQVIRANPYYVVRSSANSLLLDDFPITEGGAWSLRKLRTAYSGNAIRVRRSSDNTESNIGFTANGDLDTSSLKTFVGTGGSDNGFVVIWYDQSGLGIDILGVIGEQPRIVNAGVVERQGSMPSLFFDGSNDYLIATAAEDTINIVNKDWSEYLVQKRRTGGVNGAVLTGTGASNIVAVQFSDNNFYIQAVANSGTNGANYRVVADATSAFTLIEGYSVSNSTSAYKNNTAYSLSAALNFTTSVRTIQQIGRYGAVYTDGYISEVIHYNVNQTSNRSSIISNINTYYTIY